MWSPAGSQAIAQVVGLGWLPIRIPCFESVRGGSLPLIQLHTHPRFQVWVPSRGFSCARRPRRFLSVRPGSQATYQGACPPRVSGVRPSPLTGVCSHWGTLGLAPRHPGRFSGRVLTWSFSFGPQATDWGMRPLGCFGSVCPGSWVADQGALPPGAAGVGTQSADLGPCQPGFR